MTGPFDPPQSYSSYATGGILWGMRIAEQKALVRQQMKERTGSLDPPALRGDSDKIVRRITSMAEYAWARTILGFVALPDEPDLAQLYDRALAEGKRVALPVCRSDGTMRFHFVSLAWRTQLVSNRWHIGEPDTRICLPFEFEGNATLVLVPGIAFSPLNHRIGRGKGFYDRFLREAGSRIRSVGVCFDTQILKHLPDDDYDMSVDMLVTPSETY